MNFGLEPVHECCSLSSSYALSQCSGISQKQAVAACQTRSAYIFEASAFKSRFRRSRINGSTLELEATNAECANLATWGSPSPL